MMYLPLAEKLMEKYVEEKKVEAEAGRSSKGRRECVSIKCVCALTCVFPGRGKTVYDCAGQVGEARKGAGGLAGRAG